MKTQGTHTHNADEGRKLLQTCNGLIHHLIDNVNLTSLMTGTDQTVLVGHIRLAYFKTGMRDTG